MIRYAGRLRALKIYRSWKLWSFKDGLVKNNAEYQWKVIVFNYEWPIDVGIESSIETIGAWYQVKVINRSRLYLNKKRITLPQSTLIRMVQYFDGQLVLEFIGTAARSYKINIDFIDCKASHPLILKIQNTMSFSFTTTEHYFQVL